MFVYERSCCGFESCCCHLDRNYLWIVWVQLPYKTLFVEWSVFYGIFLLKNYKAIECKIFSFSFCFCNSDCGNLHKWTKAIWQPFNKNPHFSRIRNFLGFFCVFSRKPSLQKDPSWIPDMVLSTLLYPLFKNDNKGMVTK